MCSGSALGVIRYCLRPLAPGLRNPCLRTCPQGGGGWDSIALFMSAVCGVESIEGSAAKIAAAAAPAAARGDAVVVVAHNGPFGLGARRQDICGVDWK